MGVNHSSHQQNKVLTGNVKHENFIFTINKEEKTAEIIGIKYSCSDIFIPCSILYEKQKYTITSIVSINVNLIINSNKIESIQFPEDSKLRTIEMNAFYHSNIRTLMIPSSLKNLNNGWCSGTKNLNNIIVSKKNKLFKNFNDEFILGKTDSKSEEYDDLIFVPRNIKTIEIPSNVKRISSYSFSESLIKYISIPSNVICICNHAFYECKHLRKVDISIDSNLQVIESYSFSGSKIRSFHFPRHLSIIGEYAFNLCYKLRKIDFPEGSQLKTIKVGAFSDSRIKEITLPSSLENLNDGWCEGALKLSKVFVDENNQFYKNINNEFIVGKTDSKSDEFDDIVFVPRNNKTTKIPSNIKKISSCCFMLSDVSRVDFPPDSKIEIIEKSAFQSSLIESIFVPSSVKLIGMNAFSCCRKLKKVEFPPDSKLKEIGFGAFTFTSITSICIPDQVETCEVSFFLKGYKLQIIEINEKLNIFNIKNIKNCKKIIIFVPVKLMD